MKKTKESVTRTHLTYENRCVIETLLNEGKSIRYIAGAVGKSPSTVLREIRNHTKNEKNRKNDCVFRHDCPRHNVCGSKDCKKMCKCCTLCAKYCEDYKQESCLELQNTPYLCNGCHKKVVCNYKRKLYKAKDAEKTYRDTLRNSRNGFDLTCEQMIAIDELVTPLIKQGLSPFHIIQTVGDQLDISESTLRRLINNCDLSIRNLDLRNKVKRRPRTRRQMHNEIPLAAKFGHLYSDYLKYIEENDSMVVQMDCVEGKREDRAVLLTLHFPLFHLQLAFIMEAHTSACVVDTLDKIEEALGPELFAEVFPVILTDNGHEFMDIANMESSLFGGQRTRVFFCEPNRSDEKGSCENNHKLIRYVIPKGTSLEPYTQEQITRMMNHINSYTRKALLGQTPYTMAQKVLPEDFFILLGLEEIPSTEINLTPKLLAS